MCWFFGYKINSAIVDSNIIIAYLISLYLVVSSIISECLVITCVKSIFESICLCKISLNFKVFAIYCFCNSRINISQRINYVFVHKLDSMVIITSWNSYVFACWRGQRNLIGICIFVGCTIVVFANIQTCFRILFNTK